MLEIVSSAHRVPRAGGARCREDGAVRRTVPCVRTDLAVSSTDEADCGLEERANSHRSPRHESLIHLLDATCAHLGSSRAPRTPARRHRRHRRRPAGPLYASHAAYRTHRHRPHHPRRRAVLPLAAAAAAACARVGAPPRAAPIARQRSRPTRCPATLRGAAAPLASPVACLGTNPEGCLRRSRPPSQQRPSE